MTPFNFREFLKKQASYEGAQGYFSAQSRAWCNCFRDKLRSSKKPQQAWQVCLEEYGKAGGNVTWALKYAAKTATTLYKDANVKDDKSYHEAIQANLKAGLSVKAAIFKAMDEFFKGDQKA